MRPYKIGNIWIDLDHILAIESDIYYNTYNSHGFIGTIYFMFQDKPMEIMVSSWPTSKETIQDRLKYAQDEWDKLKDAWTNKTK